MNLITRKLRSQSGASMLIALVFMMFCLFVGGSVLAAASANGYRVKHLSDQQDFLNQRSAALLLADEIDGTVDTPTLKVTDVVLTETPKVLLPGGGLANDIYTGRTKKETRTITFTAGFTAAESMTAVQRLMFETAVCRYLNENNITLGTVGATTTTVELDGFYYAGTEIADITAFWYGYTGPSENASIGGTVSIKGNKGTATNPGEEFTSYTANFTSGEDDELFDFLVTFDNTQMTVSANAYMSRREITQPGDVKDDTSAVTGLPAGSTAVYEIAAATIKSTIKWEDAYIQKGGAGA